MQTTDSKYFFLLRGYRAGILFALLATVISLSLGARDVPGTAKATQEQWQTLEVVATAYTIAEDETKKGNVGLAAWGDRLKPGMKAIAVSRDLIPMGLDHRTRVKIVGLPGTYVVRDKMHRRWRNKVDILVGSKRKARNWGKRPVVIKWLDEGNS